MSKTGPVVEPYLAPGQVSGKALPLYPGAKLCINSGWCCKQGPCAFGTWDAERHQCQHLTADHKCGIYEEIISRPENEWYWNPAFGAGCCSPNNPARRELLDRKSAVVNPTGTPG